MTAKKILRRPTTVEIKDLGDDAYELHILQFDFHVRRECGEWTLDAYRSRVADSDRAHIGDTVNCGSLSEAIGECITMAWDLKAGAK